MTLTETLQRLRRDRYIEVQPKLTRGQAAAVRQGYAVKRVYQDQPADIPYPFRPQRHYLIASDKLTLEIHRDESLLKANKVRAQKREKDFEARKGSVEAKHQPRWPYDCDNCKLNWNCGELCACIGKALRTGKKTPKARALEVQQLQEAWRRICNYEMYKEHEEHED